MLLPGALKAEGLNQAGESMRGGLYPLSLVGGGRASPGKCFKIYVTENAFQAILKPIFSSSITSILSKFSTQTPSSLLLALHLVIHLVFW